MTSLWIGAFAAPAAGSLAFDGLAFNSRLEAVMLVLGSFALVGRNARGILRRWLRDLDDRRRWASPSLAALAVLIAALKVTTIAVGPDPGFAGCYRSLAANVAGECERSFDNLFGRRDVTRFDPEISFGPIPNTSADPGYVTGTNWRFGWLNSHRFNFYPWEKGQPVRERLPFQVAWRGTVNPGISGWVPVEYIGEGTVEIGGRRVQLEPSYGGERRVSIPIERGRQEMRIDFRFMDDLRVGESGPEGPYATVRVHNVQTERSTVGTELLKTVGQGPGWRFLASFADAMLLFVGLGLATALAVATRRAWRLLSSVAAIGLAIRVLSLRTVWGFGPLALPIAAMTLALVVLLVYLIYRRPSELVRVGIPACVVSAYYAVVPRIGFPSGVFDSVFYRPAGEDWLGYESQTRAILEEGSLRGGESIFVYAPGFRYLNFLLRTAFGDADVLVRMVPPFALAASVFVIARWVLEHGQVTSRLRGVVAVAGSALLVLFAADAVGGLAVRPISEYPTWVFLGLAVPMLFLGRSRTGWAVGFLLLGLTVFVRPHSLPAALGLFVIFAVWRRRSGAVSVRWLTLGVAIVGIFSLLPLAHNLYYGHRFVPFSRGQDVLVSIPPSELPTALIDSDHLKTLRDQTSRLLYLTPEQERARDVGIAVLALQILWGVAVVHAWKNRRRARWTDWAVLAWPVTFWLPHAVYTVFTGYYPRQIVALYVGIATAVMVVEHQLSERSSQSQATDDLTVESGPSPGDDVEATVMPSQSRWHHHRQGSQARTS